MQKPCQVILPTMLLLCSELINASPGHAGHDIPPEDLPWDAPFVAAAKQNPVAANSASITEGKKLYLQHCADCHGKSGDTHYQTGSIKRQLNTITPHREAGDLAWKISTGRGDMPPLKETLNDNAIWHLVNYLQQGFP